MHLWDCNWNIEDQLTRWDFERQRGHQIALGNREDLADLCSDIPSGDILRHVRVRLYKCNGTPAQAFQPSKVYEYDDGFPYFFLMVQSNHDLCLTAAPGQDKNGGTLILDWCKN